MYHAVAAHHGLNKRRRGGSAQLSLSMRRRRMSELRRSKLTRPEVVFNKRCSILEAPMRVYGLTVCAAFERTSANTTVQFDDPASSMYWDTHEYEYYACSTQRRWQCTRR